MLRCPSRLLSTLCSMPKTRSGDEALGTAPASAERSRLPCDRAALVLDRAAEACPWPWPTPGSTRARIAEFVDRRLQRFDLRGQRAGRFAIADVLLLERYVRRPQMADLRDRRRTAGPSPTSDRQRKHEQHPSSDRTYDET